MHTTFGFRFHSRVIDMVEQDDFDSNLGQVILILTSAGIGTEMVIILMILILNLVIFIFDCGGLILDTMH